jgi:hypothetical protein
MKYAIPGSDDCVRGDLLSRAAQAEARRTFVHRFTKTHRPYWAAGFPVQFASDTEWLANTWFVVEKDGSLYPNQSCYSCPTWPDNPELPRPPTNRNRSDCH